ncbi:MAG TPA: diguanylate cyclase [Sulfuricurvum sp.]|nr:diguanylate cyclase [Sulfuricurvum sp.]
MKEKAVVLIVDDVRINLQTLAHILKDDYTVKMAQGGREALELVALDPIPDLILLDVGMSEVSGYDVCKMLREDIDTVHIPIIFVTGKDSIEDEEYGLSLGAVDYITKPIRPLIVKARIKTHITLKQQRDLLKTMAVSDQLTGLYNRHHLTDALIRKVARANRHDCPLSVILIDIDHFKNVNDTYGHLTGDDILREVGEVIGSVARKEDIAARFGGEEFVLVLDNCRLEDAYLKAERLRQKIETLSPSRLDITASFGVAELNLQINSCTLLLDSADKALYEAKNEGRNRVNMYKRPAVLQSI